MALCSPLRDFFFLVLLCFHFVIDEAAEIQRRKLNGPVCGKSPFERQGIIAGNDADPGNWPWHVGIHINGTYFCGGSIINSLWVVTAAHCIFGEASAYVVRVGDTDRTIKEKFEADYSVAKLIPNTNWHFPQPDSDIALIKLTREITFNQYVHPVCIPRQDYDVPLISTCYLSGWGVKTLGSDQRSMYLQQANMPPLSNSECAEKTRGTDDPWLSVANLTENMICGGINGSPLSGCRGDSGGPYVCKNIFGRWVLQGVVSWGSAQCDSSQSYSVFTRVSKFIDWIEEQMEED